MYAELRQRTLDAAAKKLGVRSSLARELDEGTFWRGIFPVVPELECSLAPVVADPLVDLHAQTEEEMLSPAVAWITLTLSTMLADVRLCLRAPEAHKLLAVGEVYVVNFIIITYRVNFVILKRVPSQAVVWFTLQLSAMMATTPLFLKALEVQALFPRAQMPFLLTAGQEKSNILEFPARYVVEDQPAVAVPDVPDFLCGLLGLADAFRRFCNENPRFLEDTGKLLEELEKLA